MAIGIVKNQVALKVFICAFVLGIFGAQPAICGVKTKLDDDRWLELGVRIQGWYQSVSEKDFETPLGIVKSDKNIMRLLKEAGPGIIAANDFCHRAEHSLEFQLLFLQHLLGTDSFSIIPILCGPLRTTLPAYNRDAYLTKAGEFLRELKRIVHERDKEVIVVAGVDLSHVGMKFGHAQPAKSLAARVKEHDNNLLNALSETNSEFLWEESEKIQDQYNVCGFPALACLLEILPLCKGKVLDYHMWFEDATQSAVSFAAVIFAA